MSSGQGSRAARLTSRLVVVGLLAVGVTTVRPVDAIGAAADAPAPRDAATVSPQAIDDPMLISQVAAVTAPGVASDALRVFVRTPVNNLAQIWFEGGSWHRQDIRTDVQITSGPAAVWALGQWRVFARGVNNDLVQFWSADGTTGWKEQSLGHVLSTAPTVTIAQDDVIRVYALGSDATLWQAWSSGGAWTWQRIWAHALHSAPGAVYDTINNEHWIFAVASTGLISLHNDADGRGWQEHVYSPDSSIFPLSAPGVMPMGPGGTGNNLKRFFAEGANAEMDQFWLPGFGADNPSELSGQRLFGASIDGTPSGVYWQDINAPGVVYRAFVRDAAGRLAQYYFDPAVNAWRVQEITVNGQLQVIS